MSLEIPPGRADEKGKKKVTKAGHLNFQSCEKNCYWIAKGALQGKRQYLWPVCQADLYQVTASAQI